MSPFSLQVLADKREALLLAEVAALLHDVGKCTDLHVEHHATHAVRKWSNNNAYKVVVDNPNSVIWLSKNAANIKKPNIINDVLNATSPKAADFLSKDLKTSLKTVHVNLLDQNYSIAELIMLGTPGFATHRQRDKILEGKDGWLPALLGLCHNVAHTDKEDPIGGEQSLPNVLTSSAFGYEQQTFVVGDPQRSLNARVGLLTIDNVDLPGTREQIIKTFECGLGDTRRPTNEVSLSDWSAVVAALFKTALAGAVITQTKPGIRGWKSWRDKIIDHDFRWRLLRVNFDILALYAKSIKIADLLAYQEAVDKACADVKQLVEEEYPLGNEIYRDTTGIYFTFPDLDLPAELKQEIRRRVKAIEPELAPRIAVTTGDGHTAQEQLKTILAKARREAREALSQPFDESSRFVLAEIDKAWQVAQKEPGRWEVCPVCGLRPKEEHAEVCPHCENRRKSRTQAWLDNPAETIWVGEIADHNQRLALLVGKFDLAGWLSGVLVQTMLVKADPATNTFTPKNPSPARLRRVWETCQQFWKKTIVGHTLPKTVSNAEIRRVRYRLIPDKTEGWKTGPAYNGFIGDKPIDLFWDGKAFLTINNLEWLLSEEERQSNRRAALEKFLRPGTKVTLDDPDNPRRQYTITIQSAEPVTGKFANYQPFLSLLTTPDQFMVLVPAADAPDVVRAVRAEYEAQFGKVRNRLPLALNLVFFERKTPLIAVLDAARAMLGRTVSSEQWTVAAKTDLSPLPDGNPRKVRLTLKRNGRQITVTIPTVMGDGVTFDPWYPYWRVEGKPTGRTYWFIGPDGEHWVHVKDLREGDTVHFTPATIDYLWLDSAARRFDAAYDEQGRRYDRLHRPWTLEDFAALEDMWQKHITRLSKAQIKQILQIIEGTRQRWFGRDREGKFAADETFRQFVKNILATAAWPKDHRWKDILSAERDALTAAALRGELTDLEELHFGILKEALPEQPCKKEGEPRHD